MTSSATEMGQGETRNLFGTVQGMAWVSRTLEMPSRGAACIKMISYDLVQGAHLYKFDDVFQVEDRDGDVKLHITTRMYNMSAGETSRMRHHPPATCAGDNMAITMYN